jgi:hypothetical protein
VKPKGLAPWEKKALDAGWTMPEARAKELKEKKDMIIGLCGPAGSGKDTAADFLVKNHGFAKVAFADPLKRICKDVFAFTDEQLWGPSEKRNAVDERFKNIPHVWGPIISGMSICQRCGCWSREIYVKDGQHVIKGSQEHTDCVLTTRYALQRLGTEWGRDCYPDVWVDYALRTATRLLADDRDDPNGVNYYSQKSGLLFVGGLQKPKGVVISDVRFKNEVRAINAAGGAVFLMKRPTTLEGAAAKHLSETAFSTIPEDYFSFTINNDGTLDELERFTATALAWVRDK